MSGRGRGGMQHMMGAPHMMSGARPPPPNQSRMASYMFQDMMGYGAPPPHHPHGMSMSHLGMRESAPPPLPPHRPPPSSSSFGIGAGAAGGYSGMMGAQHSGRENVETRRPVAKCFKCGKDGHVLRDCPSKFFLSFFPFPCPCRGSSA
jgi:hypothetical protein